MAQQNNKEEKYFIAAQLHYGFIPAHTPTLHYLIKKHIIAGEVNFFKIPIGAKKWQQLYRYPDMGIGIFFAPLGNPILGTAIGLYPYVNLPLNASEKDTIFPASVPRKKIKYYVRIGDGIGILTQPYNRIANHKNNAIGSMLNAAISLRFSALLMHTRSFRTEVGIGLTHFSNGAFTVPNLGINLATVHVGFSMFSYSRYKRNSPIHYLTKEKGDDEEKNRRGCLNITLNIGWNELSPPGGKKYVALSLYGTRWQNLSQKYRIGGGVDVFYNWANLERDRRDTLFAFKNDIENFRGGIRIGQELLIGKVAFPVEMGMYVYSKMKQDGLFYHRIGIRYYWSEKIVLNYTLKSHWAVAENIEWGIGYQF